MPYRVVAIGDIGMATPFHLGDEAMLEAALIEIGRREDVIWSLISADPAESTRRYSVESLARMGFATLGTVGEREARLAEIEGAARGDTALRPGDPAQAVLNAVRAADAVLITGGGNLNSTWPEHIYERSALTAIARVLAKPVVVSGQSLGPQLTRRDGELVSASLTSAHLVGVREHASASVARRLGVLDDRIWCAADDAAFIAGQPVPDLLAELDVARGQFVAATFSMFAGALTGEEVTTSVAELLDGIVASTGLDVVLIPHLGSFDPGRTDDRALHDNLVEAAKSDRITAAPMLSSREAAWLTRQAALVVSSRYHPVVFGIAAGIPTVGIAVDAHTENKIRGALALVGLDGWCVSILGLRSGVVAEAVDEAWLRRVAIAEGLTRSVRHLEEDKSRYWDAVALAITGKPIPSPPSSDGYEPVSDAACPDGDWTVRNEDATQWTRMFADRTGDLQRSHDGLAAQVTSLADEVERERLARCAALDEVAALAEALAVEKAGREAAQLANAEIVDWADEESRAADLMRQAMLKQALPAELVRQAAYAVVRDTKFAGPARSVRSLYRRVRRGDQA